LINKSEEDNDSFFRRGFLYFILEEYDKARADIEHILKKDYGNPVLLCLSGLIASRLEDDVTAWENFDIVCENNPMFVNGYLGKAVYEFFQDDNSLATVEVGNAIDTAPSDARGYLYRGFINLSSDDFDYAIEDLKIAKKLSPDWNLIIDKYIERAYINNGIINTDNEKYFLAVNNFNQAINTNPTNPENYFLLGETHMNIEDWDTAIECFEKAFLYSEGKKIGKDALEMLEMINELKNNEDDDYEEEENTYEEEGEDEYSSGDLEDDES
jgi:tetratricopeptide (TPR) repeat protein